MCSTDRMGAEAAVDAADSAVTGALRDGVDHLTHDQSRELHDRLRTLTAKCEALSLAVVGKVDADGTYTYDGTVTT
ncbi:MAG: hypothetical protein ACJ786_01435, partial [Catenulispora sp.]